MKKLMLIFLVAAIVFSIAACGKTDPTTEDDTTTTTTAPSQSTDTEETTTEETTEESTTVVTETTPPSENLDLSEYLLTYPNEIVDGESKETKDENGRLFLSGSNEMLEIKIKDEEKVDLFIDVEKENTDSSLNSYKKAGYTWIVEIDGTEYEITDYILTNYIPAMKKMGMTANAFLVIKFNLTTAGFESVQEENHPYEIKFVIKGTDGEVAFFAELGTVTYTEIMLMIEDSSRVGTLYDGEITATGPAGFNASQEVGGAFDGKIFTKFCTPDITIEPIVITTADTLKLTSISFVTAEDSARFSGAGGRLPTGIIVEGSSDGENWVTLIDVPEAVFEDIENFKEYNFKIASADQAEFNNYRFTFEAEGTIQFSEIMLFEE